MLLLYSGGLDTSVMLKWIQESYGAEIVTLTVDLGQPGEDWEVVDRQGARARRASRRSSSTRARSSREEYVLPAIKRQRPLRRRLPALHRARPAADRQARGRAGARARLRHDRPRLHRQGQRPGAHRGHDRDARPRAEDDRPGARVADGPRGGDRLRPRARDPGRRAGPRSRRTRSTTTSGAARRRGARSRTSTSRRPSDVFQLVTPPETRARRGRDGRRSGSRRGARSRSTASGWASSSCIERAAELGCRNGVGIVDHIEDRVVGLKVRDIYEVPAAAIVLTAHRELEKLVCDGPPEPVQAARSSSTGPTSATPGCGWSRCAATSTPTWTSANEHVTGAVDAEALQGDGDPRARAAPRMPSTTASLASLRRVRGRVQPAGEPRASSSCSRSSRGWPTA